MARFQAKLSLSWFGLARFKPNSVCPDLGWPVSSQTQFVLIWAGPSQAKLRKWLKGLKQTGFLRFYSICCPILFASRQSLCTWHRYFVKNIGFRLLFAAVYPTETKVRHSTGVATTNSTNRYPNANKLSWAINYPPFRHCPFFLPLFSRGLALTFFVFSMQCQPYLPGQIYPHKSLVSILCHFCHLLP